MPRYRSGGRQSQLVRPKKSKATNSLDPIPSSLVASSSAPSISQLSAEPPSSETSSLSSSLSSSPTIESSPTPPRGILEQRCRISSLPSSTTSFPNTSNIKFAPLPELAPRRRKSAVPLGVAARGEMMRRRRALRESTHENNGGGMWTKEEVQAQRQRASPPDQPQELIEDPFVVLGKLVKGAWRKIHSKAETPTNPPIVVTDADTDTTTEDKVPICEVHSPEQRSPSPAPERVEAKDGEERDEEDGSPPTPISPDEQDADSDTQTISDIPTVPELPAAS